MIALPVALLVGAGTFALLNDDADPAAPLPAPTASATAGPVPTAPVEMAAPELTEREEIVCRAVTSQLPAEVDGLVQRAVTDGPEQNAAYGEPPVTLACGPPAAEYEPTDQLYPWAGVCWHHADEPDGGGTVWTTLGREVPVRVRVPAAYEAPFQHVLEFSETVAATVLTTEQVC